VEGHGARAFRRARRILLDITNEGLWMAHCHIAEHNQSGMMFSFPVSEKEAS
jgi:FtsP/CotA-like multicopper oxidase with cupredoxin domain